MKFQSWAPSNSNLIFSVQCAPHPKENRPDSWSTSAQGGQEAWLRAAGQPLGTPSPGTRGGTSVGVSLWKPQREERWPLPNPLSTPPQPSHLPLPPLSF